MWRPPCLLQDQSRKAAASFARIAERFMLLRTRGIRTLTAIPQNVWFADPSCPLSPRKLLPPSLTAVSALGQKLPRQFAGGVAALMGSPPRRHALPALIVINENPDLSLATYSPLHQ